MDLEKIDLSVVLITLNEEKRIATAIASLPVGCEVIVLDSGSSDATAAIARNAGAKVSTRTFDNYSAQKNAALALASRKWILSIDADEVLSPQLSLEIKNLINSEYHPHQAYRLKRRLVFMEKTLRFGKSSDQPIRLFLKGKAFFKNEIHEQLVVTGKTSCLKNYLYHHSYENISDYFRCFNQYTSQIAINHLKSRKKSHFFNVLRPWLEFNYRYLILLGFLDGYPGYCYALFSSLYAFVKYAKLKELHDLRK